METENLAHDKSDTPQHELEQRRLSRRRRTLDAPAPIDEYQWERAEKHLTSLAVPEEDSHEVITSRRTIRWKPSRSLVIILGLLILLLCGIKFSSPVSTPVAADLSDQPEATITESGQQADSPLSIDQSSPHAEPQKAWVHVAGAVNKPGLYEVTANSRISQAIDAAGGPVAEADLNRINLAAKIQDGQQIYIPLTGEQFTTSTDGNDTETASPAEAEGLINLNTASQEELETLPRVGPATAQKILDWREENGGFSSVEELDAVPGIGPAMLEALTPLVTV